MTARLIVLLLFMLPLTYPTAVLGTLLHEVVGHGMFAKLVGGRFHGFSVKWHCAGYAYTSLPPELGPRRRILHSAGGMLVDFAGSAMWLAGAYLLRHEPMLSLPCLVFGFFGAHTVGSYLMYDSLQPKRIGDPSRIVGIWQDRNWRGLSILKYGMFTAGCVLFFMSTAVFYPAYLSLMEQMASPTGRQLDEEFRMLVIVFALFMPSIIWWHVETLSWQSVLPVGQWPLYANMAAGFPIIILLNWVHPRIYSVSGTVALAWWCPLISIALLVGVAFVVVRYLQKGVYWGEQPPDPIARITSLLLTRFCSSTATALTLNLIDGQGPQDEIEVRLVDRDQLLKPMPGHLFAAFVERFLKMVGIDGEITHVANRRFSTDVKGRKAVFALDSGDLSREINVRLVEIEPENSVDAQRDVAVEK